MSKKTKGKKKGKELLIPEEEIPEEILSLTEEELQSQIELFKNKLEKASKDRSFISIEKDSLNTFYEITKNDVVKVENQIKEISRDMEEVERQHKVHLCVLDQKVKGLAYENENRKETIKNEILGKIDSAENEHKKIIKNVIEEKSKKVSLVKQKAQNFQEEVKSLETNFIKKLEMLSSTYQANFDLYEKKFAEEIRSLKEELDLQRKVEMHEIEERKNLHIEELNRNHKESFEAIKSYYRDITKDNLKLIQSLKEEIQEMKVKEKTNQKKMHGLSIQNKQLTEPLKEKEEVLTKLKIQLKSFDTDKMIFKNLKSRNVQLDEKLVLVRKSVKKLEEKFKKIEKERNDILAKFEEGVENLNKKGKYKNILLEKKFENIFNQL